MSDYNAGDTWERSFQINEAGVGAVDADSLPTAVLRRNLVNTAVTVTVAHLATGDYTALAVIPSGYATGDEVEIIVTATVAGQTQNMSIDAFRLGTMAASGTGADSVTLTISDEDGAVPDAQVWVSSDSAGNNVVAGTKATDSAGQVTFLLHAGTTYYLWCQRDGVNPILGAAFVAVADS